MWIGSEDGYDMKMVKPRAQMEASCSDITP